MLGFGLGIGDWGLGLGSGIGAGIWDWDWDFPLYLLSLTLQTYKLLYVKEAISYNLSFPKIELFKDWISYYMLFDISC